MTVKRKEIKSEQDEDAGWEELNRCRKKIDAIDDQILSLLRRRLDAAAAIGEAKSKVGMAVFDPVREKTILDRVAAQHKGRLSPEVIRDIFARIICAGRAVQETTE